MDQLKKLLSLSGPEAFDEVSQQLLLRTELVINGQPYNILEIEFYVCNDQHPDIFCHQFRDQKTNLQWYFHRASEKLHSYKGGNYKGLDITCGSESSYGGILIRSIQSEKGGSVIDSPCKCVNQILIVCGCTTVKNLVTEKLKNDITITNPLLYLQGKQVTCNLNIFQSHRVGLTLKTSNPVKLKLRHQYISKLYRYLTHPTQIAKYKKLTTLIAVDNHSQVIINSNFGISGKSLDLMKTQIKDVKSQPFDPTQYEGKDLTDSDRIKLFFCNNNVSVLINVQP
jgi:3-methyladenine DNA glycosylase Mpg